MPVQRGQETVQLRLAERSAARTTLIEAAANLLEARAAVKHRQDRMLLRRVNGKYWRVTRVLDHPIIVASMSLPAQLQIGAHADRQCAVGVDFVHRRVAMPAVTSLVFRPERRR